MDLYCASDHSTTSDPANEAVVKFNIHCLPTMSNLNSLPGSISLHSSPSPTDPSRPEIGTSSGTQEGQQRPPKEPPAIHVIGRKPSAALLQSAGSRLEQLPQEVFRNVLGHMQQADPASVLAAAHTSRTMRAHIKASGIPKAEILIRKAKNASLNPATASTVLDEVIAAAKDQTIPLSSEQRLDIITVLPLEFVTMNGARSLVELVKNLKPEHQGSGICYVRNVIQQESGADNLELVDRFTDIAMSLRNDKEKSDSMYLLDHFHNIPESDRLTRFDRLAPLSETIKNEQEKAISIASIAVAIRTLPSPAMNDRFTKYANVTHSIKNDSAKATAAAGLAHCIWDLPQDVMRNAFDTLVSITRSIDDDDAKREVVGVLRLVIHVLPLTERDTAQASLATVSDN